MNKMYLAAACLNGFMLFGCQSNRVTTAVSEVQPPQPEVIVNKPKYEEFIKAGDTLPIDTITDIDGNLIDFNSLEKRKLVVLFATWCSDSNRALKALNESVLLSNTSVQIIAIAREETAEKVKVWRDKFDIKVPLAVDSDRSIYKQFAVGGIPRLITVSKDNKVIKMNLAEGENQLDLVVW
jgi:peroxiredoxin